MPIGSERPLINVKKPSIGNGGPKTNETLKKIVSSENQFAQSQGLPLGMNESPPLGQNKFPPQPAQK